MADQDGRLASVDAGQGAALRERFWELSLDELSDAEWEALCDSCGQCCLHKFEDEESGEIVMSSIVCRYLDQGCGRCTVYAERSVKKPECFVIAREPAETLALHMSWLPETCAYRLRYEGKALYIWHPLLVAKAENGRVKRASSEGSGGVNLRAAMIEAGVATDEWATSEAYVHEADWAGFLPE